MLPNVTVRYNGHDTLWIPECQVNRLDPISCRHNAWVILVPWPGYQVLNTHHPLICESALLLPNAIDPLQPCIKSTRRALFIMCFTNEDPQITFVQYVCGSEHAMRLFGDHRRHLVYGESKTDRKDSEESDDSDRWISRPGYEG